MLRFAALLLASIAGVASTAWAQPEKKAPPRRVTAAGTHRSPDVARRLALGWYDAIMPAVPKAPAAKKSDPPKPLDRLPLATFRKQVRRVRLRPRPAVVHVYDPSFKMGELLRLERSVFGTESLLIAAGFVDRFRVKERPDLPAGFWTTDAEGRVTARLPLNPTGREIESALAGVFSSHFEGTLPQAVARYAAWLDRLEAAEDALARERTPARAVDLVRARRTEPEARPKRRKPPREPDSAPSKG